MQTQGYDHQPSPFMAADDWSTNQPMSAGLNHSASASHVEQCDVYTPGSDFWTGGYTPRRRGSVNSCSSSMNSSLHGYASFDPQEQQPTFIDTGSRSSSADFGDSSRGLPPAPVPLRPGKKLSFECDICGSTVHVDRRLDWQ